MDRAGLKPPFLRVSLRVFELDVARGRQPTWGVGEVGGRDRFFESGAGHWAEERMKDQDLKRFLDSGEHEEFKKADQDLPPWHGGKECLNCGLCVSYGRTYAYPLEFRNFPVPRV